MNANIEQPLRITIPYRPRQWQNDVYKSLKRFNVLVCHRASGKSHMCMNILIKAATEGPAWAEYFYILPLRNQAQRNVWVPLKRLTAVIPGMRYNNASLECVFPNNAKITVIGADDPEKLRGAHLHAVVLDEFADMGPNIWRAVRPMLSTYKGWVIWIGTPKGTANQFHEFYQMSQEPDRKDWYGVMMPWWKSKALDPSEVESMRSEMSSDEFAQELECSWTASNRGSYYSKQITELRESGQISYDKLYRHDLETHIAFDIGFRDKTAIWFAQIMKDPVTREDRIHLIDFEQDVGLSLKDWAEIIRNREKLFGYRRGTIIWPHDIAVHEWGSGISRIETAEQVGLRGEICPRQDVMDGIELCRRHLPRCSFDLTRCADGVEALSQYKAKVDKMGNSMRPDHDQNSNAADSFRYLITWYAELYMTPQLMRMPIFRR